MRKKITYLIAAILLSFIQFVRTTQYEGAFLPAVNLTGIAMMLIIFSIIPRKKIFNIPNYIYTGVCCAAMIATYIYWRSTRSFLILHYETVILNVWWLGIALRYLFDYVFLQQNGKIKIGVAGILWLVFTALTVIGPSGKWWPLWFFLMFGTYYILPFSKEDLKDLYDQLMNGTIISFFLLQGFAYLFRPYDDIRYSGAFVNCNDMALYYLIVYVMILTKLHLFHVRKDKLWKKIVFFLGAGAMLSFQFVTLGRTAWVASFVITIGYGIVVVIIKWKDNIGRTLLRGVSLLLCMALMFPIVFLSIRYLPTVHPHPIWFQDEYSEAKVHSWDPRDSEKYTDMGELLDAALGRFSMVFDFFEKKAGISTDSYGAEADVTRVNVDIVTDNWETDSISARVNIYKGYLENSTWLGRNENTYQLYYGDSDRRMWHAQNLWLQAIFNFGYIAGAILLVLTVWILIIRFKCVIKSDNPYNVLALLLTLVFFIYGMMELVWLPGLIVMTLFFLMQKKLPE